MYCWYTAMTITTATTITTGLGLKNNSGGTASWDWNREHVFPKSLASPALKTSSKGPGTDVHNLKPCDGGYNSTRNNRKYTSGSGNSGIQSDGGFYPGDEWKGDVARIVMFMYLRYHGNGSSKSEQSCLPKNVTTGVLNSMDSNMINLLLEWNESDPVNAFESNRNEVIYGIQNNRNPFIDNPYLATLLWGGTAAEDKWGVFTQDTEAPTKPSNLQVSQIESQQATVSWSASTDNVAVTSYEVYVGQQLKTTTSQTSITLSDLTAATSYVVAVKAKDDAGNTSLVSEALSFTTSAAIVVLFEEQFEDCNAVQFNAYSVSSNKDWTCQSVYGESNSGSYGMNGYQEDVPSNDWLVTNQAINFDLYADEVFSLWTTRKFGASDLTLVYSSNYQGGIQKMQIGLLYPMCL